MRTQRYGIIRTRNIASNSRYVASFRHQRFRHANAVVSNKRCSTEMKCARVLSHLRPIHCAIKICIREILECALQECVFRKACFADLFRCLAPCLSSKNNNDNDMCAACPERFRASAYVRIEQPVGIRQPIRQHSASTLQARRLDAVHSLPLYRLA